jgi:hypothetical protein
MFGHVKRVLCDFTFQKKEKKKKKKEQLALAVLNTMYDVS